MKTPKLLILLLPILLTLGSCTDSNFAATIRKVTYPPDFKYVSGDELRTSMNQLAFQVMLLDNALATGDTAQYKQQEQVVGTLRTIESIGSKLQAGDSGTNHPFLQDNMRDFVNNVNKAREAASQTPPNYYLAGRVSGGCINCHKINR